MFTPQPFFVTNSNQKYFISSLPFCTIYSHWLVIFNTHTLISFVNFCFSLCFTHFFRRKKFFFGFLECFFPKKVMVLYHFDTFFQKFVFLFPFKIFLPLLLYGIYITITIALAQMAVTFSSFFLQFKISHTAIMAIVKAWQQHLSTFFWFHFALLSFNFSLFFFVFCVFHYDVHPSF